MTETEKRAAGSVGQTDPAAAATETLDRDDKNSTYSKVKNFTSETNNDDDITTREEINYLHKSVANLRSDVRKIFREELKAALNGGVQR
jgi:hypothetical protein